jgi:toxin ParE1/3/4
MGQVHTRESAKRDLVDHFVYLAENASIETAERFLSRAESSFLDLARHPRMGLNSQFTTKSCRASASGACKTS